MKVEAKSYRPWLQYAKEVVEPNTHTLRVFVWKGQGDQPWRWHIRSRNGRSICCSGEGFVSRSNAVRALNNVLEAIERKDYYHHAS